MFENNKLKRKVYRQWLKGTINVIATAKRIGYKKENLRKGIQRVHEILSELGVRELT